MFKRINYEEWQAMAPIIAFLLTFAVFLFQVVRALCIKSDQSEHLARLPLDDDGSGTETITTPFHRKP
jgi:hypothetical protein